MSKHTHRVTRNAIQDAIEENSVYTRYRILGPERPARVLNDLYKKQSERLRARR